MRITGSAALASLGRTQAVAATDSATTTRLRTQLVLMARMALSRLNVSGLFPGYQHMPLQGLERDRHQRPEQAAGAHSHQNEAGFQRQPLGLNHVAEPGLSGDQFGRDDGHPRLTKPDP